MPFLACGQDDTDHNRCVPDAHLYFCGSRLLCCSNGTGNIGLGYSGWSPGHLATSFTAGSVKKITYGRHGKIAALLAMCAMCALF